MTYTELKNIIRAYANADVAPLIETWIGFGQMSLEDIIMEEGVGLSFMEATPVYTPSLLTGINTFTLPSDYLEMQYFALTDQMPSPVITVTDGGTGGSLSIGTYYYRVTAINATGETLPSQVSSVVLSVGTRKATITWTAITGATSYKVYGRSTGGELYIATVTAPTITYTDAGTVTPAGAMPTQNSSGTQRYSIVDRYSSKKFGDVAASYINPNTKSRPIVYEKQGSTLVFNAHADIDYAVDLRYWKRDTVLSDTNTTNNWLTSADRALLYASLSEAIPYLGAVTDAHLAVPNAHLWVDKRDEEIKLLKSRNTRERISGRAKNYLSGNIAFASGRNNWGRSGV